MNHLEVQLVGVGPTADDEPFEAFIYTVNAPTNLHMTALTEQGTRMGLTFMGWVLNQLIEGDCFTEGDCISLRDQGDTTLLVHVGEEVPARSVEAFLAETDTVRRVRVVVLGMLPEVIG